MEEAIKTLKSKTQFQKHTNREYKGTLIIEKHRLGPKSNSKEATKHITKIIFFSGNPFEKRVKQKTKNKKTNLIMQREMIKGALIGCPLKSEPVEKHTFLGVGERLLS